jgi:Transposase, Mutator family
MMLDGMEIADRCHVVALGISTDRVKIPLGLWEGSTENATLARELLSDLVERGLDPEQAILFVIDGGKALRRAIKDVFGEHALVHRCHRHRSATSVTCFPSATGPRSWPRSAGRGHSPTRPWPSSDSSGSPPSSSGPGPTPPLAQGGPGRHADADAARDQRAARQDPVLDEPVREHFG